MTESLEFESHIDFVEDIIDEEYVVVEEDTFIGMAIDQFRSFEPEDDETTIYYVYVIDADGYLTGVLSLRELLNAPEDELVSSYMTDDVVSVGADMDVEEAAKLIQRLEFRALPVVDAEGLFLGVLRSEDMMAIMEEEATEDILKHAGFTFADVELSRSAAILESSYLKILRIRMPWLVVALAGGLLAGGVIGQFEAELEAVVALAFFVPVIMDMGGNVGTQASTIFVRGLAVGHIDDRNAMRHFAREGVIGLVIGVLIGTLGAAAAYLWQGVIEGEEFALELAVVVFVGLVAVCVVASVVGYVIPWIAHKVGLDPAAASDPLITTVKDVTALIIYFSLAAILLSELV